LKENAVSNIGDRITTAATTKSGRFARIPNRIPVMPAKAAGARHDGGGGAMLGVQGPVLDCFGRFAASQ
jgi:hypothetical protein